MSLINSEYSTLKALPCFDRILNITVIGVGMSQTCFKVTTISAVYFVKKLNRATAKTEISCAQWLSSSTHILTPAVLYYDQQWLVTSYIEANTLEQSTQSYWPKIKTSLSLMCLLHKEDTSKLDYAALPQLNIQKTVDDLLHSSLVLLVAKKTKIQQVTSLLANLMNTKGSITNDKRVICHGDMNYQNILIDAAAKSWLIDFEAAHLAPAEFDVAMFIAVNTLSLDDIDEITATYSLNRLSSPLNLELLHYFIMYCFLINGLWYLNRKSSVANKEEFHRLAIEQWSLFNQFALKFGIDLPTLA